MKCKTSNASFVAAWLFSSFETNPRQKSEESISVGLKCLQAKVLLPEPEAPMSTTNESSGMVTFISVVLVNCKCSLHVRQPIDCHGQIVGKAAAWILGKDGFKSANGLWIRKPFDYL